MISPAMRTLLLSALLFSTLAAAQNHNSGPTKFNEATIAQLQADMASGKVTSVELTQFYITRILALDQKGPVSQRLRFWRRRSVCAICRNHAANRTPWSSFDNWGIVNWMP